MSFAPFIAVVVACLGAVACTFLVGGRAVAAALRGRSLDAEQRLTVFKSVFAFGAVAFGPAVLIGIVVGGTLGNAYGPIGIALGTFAVVVAILALAVVAGAYVGRAITGART